MIKIFKLFSFKPTLIGGLFLAVTALAKAQQPAATTPAQLKQSPRNPELRSDPDLRSLSGRVDTVRERSFDRDWLFFKGEATGAEAPSFDDSGWRSLDVPNDWTYQGKALGIARPTGSPGRIFVHASADGLAPATLTLKVDAVKSGVSSWFRGRNAKELL